MLGKVVVENGVKKIVPLTADCGSGNPVGTVIAVYSNKVPNGYLPCNGVAFDTAQFPVLYALLQDDHTPDLRECTLKGIGESGRTVGAHVKAGGLAVGEFVDDQVQEHKHDYVVGETGVSGTPAYYTGSNTVVNFHNAHSTNNNGRSGATTEVKAVGVNWCIKATSGINENQADNVLSALTPVNAVTSGDMHAVTSNAVYDYLPFRVRSYQKKRVTISSINSHGYVIKTLSEMGFTALNDNYIVCVCNNITGGAGIFVTGNGASSLMFFNSAGDNRTNVTIDVAIIYLI